MASIAPWIEDSAQVMAPGTRSRQELMKWLGAELKERAPKSAHDQLSEAFLRALWDYQPIHGTWFQRAILKQEVWRLLVTFRASGRNNSGAIADFEAVIPGLVRRLELMGAEQETVLQVDQRLQEALEDVRDWPLV